VCLVVGILALLAAGSPAHGSLMLVTSRAAFQGTDFIDWGKLGPEFTNVADPFAITSANGLNVTVSKPLTPPISIFQRRDENATMGGWSGNFLLGDKLLWNSPLIGTGGPVTLDFGTTAVNGGGAQIQTEFFGTFVAKIEAFDALGNSLGSFTETGNSQGGVGVPEDGSAIFIGVRSDAFDIHKITLSLVSAPPLNPEQDFAINQFDINPAQTPTPVPEAGTLALFALGVLGLAGFRGRWRRRPA
jgi:hypothetical protein